MKKEKLHGYGARELILVLLVLWALILFLVKRLSVMNAISNDTARVADIHEINTALSAYYIEFNNYPFDLPTSLTSDTAFAQKYFAITPQDPIASSKISIIENFSSIPWFYVIIPGKGNDSNRVMTIAKAQHESKANLHTSGIYSGTKIDQQSIQWENLMKRSNCPNGLSYTTPESSENNPCNYDNSDHIYYIWIREN